mgnify:CR=1 FL=1
MFYDVKIKTCLKFRKIKEMVMVDKEIHAPSISNVYPESIAENH